MTTNDRSGEVEVATQLLKEYCAAIDGRDLQGLARLITDDIEIARPAGALRGREEVLAFYRDKFASDPNEQRHLAGEVAVHRQGDELIITAPFSAAAVSPDGPVTVIMGHYRDLARQAEDGLRLARKEITFRSRQIDDLDNG